MSDYEYFCLIESEVEVVEIKVRSFSADGTKGDEQKAMHGDKKKLGLIDQSGNTVKYEYWDVTWTGGNCYGPVNNGDTVKFYGAASGFEVEINGKVVGPIDCPD